MFTLRMARKWVVRFVFLESGCYWWMNSGKHWETIFTLSFDNSTSLLGSTIKFSDSVTMKSLQLPIFVGHKNRPSRVRPLTSQQLGKLRAAAMVAASSAAEALERIGESAWQRTKHSLKRRTLQPKMGICLERPCHSTEAAWGWKKMPLKFNMESQKMYSKEFIFRLNFLDFYIDEINILYSSSYDTKRLRGSFSLGDFRWLRFKVNAMSTHIALKFSHKSVKQQHPKGNSCSKPIFHDLPRAAFSKVRMNCHKQNTIRNIEKKRSQQTTLGHLWDSGLLQRSQNINIITIPSQGRNSEPNKTHIFLIDFPNAGQRGKTILLRYIHHHSIEVRSLLRKSSQGVCPRLEPPNVSHKFHDWNRLYIIYMYIIIYRHHMPSQKGFGW